ncbi:MAG: aspartate 1-decarboxylase, partial [Planctomycetaceae bacterium]|nr:aspartate 1-decarboxylase [Planctomycetaceae bacterium]
VGDRIIVMAFGEFQPEELALHRPQVVVLDQRNRIVERVDYPPVCRACEPEALGVLEVH